ncbi:hypothetical protein [Sporomusa sp.]|uniref:hypothetical protein n=1 Tax=Sporomusa sp. TaxID=2078658 RepID=UPI002B8D11C9|nr:hypothetical protein [Sporomusa sp.]HWR44936.1 hypothetical protein [Sporomusa sp.]
MKLPLRFRILHLISQNTSLSDAEIMNALRSEYGSEGQFKQSIIDIHLASMRAVGMIEATELSLDAQGDLLQKYKITDYGFSRLSYLPGTWRKTGSKASM